MRARLLSDLQCELPIGVALPLLGENCLDTNPTFLGSYTLFPTIMEVDKDVRQNERGCCAPAV